MTNVMNNTNAVVADNNTKVSDLGELSSDSTLDNDAEANLNDIMLLLQKVYQKMRNMLQEQNQKQTNNSFKMAMSAIAEKRAAAAETYNGSKTASIIQMTTGALSGVTGVASATGIGSKLLHSKPINKMRGNTDSHSSFLSEDKASELNKQLDEIKLTMPEVNFVSAENKTLRYQERFVQNTHEVANEMANLRGSLAQAYEKSKSGLSKAELSSLNDRYKKASKQINSIESVLKGVAPKVESDKGAMVGNIFAQTLNSAGNAGASIVTSNATYAASKQQITGDYISQSQNVYDKQSDKDAANMKEFSQKLTDTTRALTDLHGQMAHAVTWK